MKKSLSLFITIGLALAACGPTKTDPLKGHQTGGVNLNADQTKYVYVKEEVPVTKEVAGPKETEYVTKEKPVEKIVYVSKEVQQIVAQGEAFHVTYPTNVVFIEGKEKSFDFTVDILKGKVNFDLNIANAPKGAKIAQTKKDVNTVSYKMTWTADVGSLNADEYDATDKITITLKDLQYVSDKKEENDAVKTVFDNVSKSRDIEFVVRRTNDVPTVKVNGLASNSNRKVGETFAFTVEVTNSGSEQNPPLLNVDYDIVNAMTAKGFEASGAAYVQKDAKHPVATKNGSVWTYYFIFDTTLPMQPSLDKNKKVIPNADKLLVNVTFQAAAAFKAPSDIKKLQFAIELNPVSVAQTLDAGKKGE